MRLTVSSRRCGIRRRTRGLQRHAPRSVQVSPSQRNTRPQYEVSKLHSKRNLLPMLVDTSVPAPSTTGHSVPLGQNYFGLLTGWGRATSNLQSYVAGPSGRQHYFGGGVIVNKR